MKNIGLITYHAAYNYGSVLQAYGTQEAVKKLGYNIEIINYRTKWQKAGYQLYRSKYGKKTLIKDLMMLPVENERKKRIEKFENFFSNELCITDELSEPEDVYKHWDVYDEIISGSDQIWNKHTRELRYECEKYIQPYILKGFCGEKISYATSVGRMMVDELKLMKKEFNDYKAISIREDIGCKRMMCALNRKVTTVLDPTFLLNKSEWIERFGENNKYGKYVLYYSLKDSIYQNNVIDFLEKTSDYYGCKIFCVMPYAHFLKKSKKLLECASFGPKEFINIINNACFIITDTFHGTALSVNFCKDFLSVCEQSDARKEDLLMRLNLTDNIISRLKWIDGKFPVTDVTSLNEKLEHLREQSIIFLKNSL